MISNNLLPKTTKETLEKLNALGGEWVLVILNTKDPDSNKVFSSINYINIIKT